LIPEDDGAAGAPVPGLLLFISWFPEGFSMLFRSAAALPASLLGEPVPVPVVPLFTPALGEHDEDPLIPAPAPPVPVPALAPVPPLAPAEPPAPPAPPPAPCAAAPKSINAVAKPIAVNFMCCSCCSLVARTQTVDPQRVPKRALQELLR
jgi:hypothetical protein